MENSAESVQSVSNPKSRSSLKAANQQSNRSTCAQPRKARHGKISSLLSQSLALLLSRVNNECGNETAASILNVLQDECFDIGVFRKEMCTMKECEEISKSLMKGSEN